MLGGEMDLVKTISAEEVGFIAGLDYGQDRESHEAALRSVIWENADRFTEGQQWFPYEVVELGASHLQAGHEREFAICTLLVIRAVATGFDKATDLAEKRASKVWEYGQLPAQLADAIDVEYVAAGCK